LRFCVLTLIRMQPRISLYWRRTSPGLFSPDVERKRLHGLAPLARTASRLGEGLYDESTTRGVYSRLAEAAREVVSSGYTAIVDATFLARASRIADRGRKAADASEGDGCHSRASVRIGGAHREGRRHLRREARRS
jgi:hypothetical protein